MEFMTTDHERDLRRYSAERAKDLAAFFGRPVHELTLDEINHVKILEEKFDPTSGFDLVIHQIG